MIDNDSGSELFPDGRAPRSPRRRVLLAGQYQSLAGTFPADVRNLSSTGASIMCAAELKLGSEGVLMAGGLDCLCRVVWHRAGVFGLKFEEPLHNSVVLDLHRVTSDEVKYAERVATHAWYHRDAR